MAEAAPGALLSTAQFEEIIAAINTGLSAARTKLTELRTMNIQWLPDAIEEPLLAYVRGICASAEELIRAVQKVMEPAFAPLRIALMAKDWGGRVQEYATQVEANTRWTELKALDEWEGRAADRYRKKILSQSAAADRLGEMASIVSIQMGASATTGVAFYAGVGMVVAKLLWGLYIAANEARTGPGALAGLATAWTSIKSAEVGYGKLVLTTSTFLGEQGADYLVLVNQANDRGQFPGDSWPKGVVEAGG